ncbi:MAG: hypothetical protein ACYTG5_01480 [Planctomycetota bacterium]|jgi:hypothetical protein
MQGVLQWLATWMGLEIEPGTELRFELSGFPSGGQGLLVLLGLALAISIVAYAYRRDGHSLSKWQRITLGSLRGLAVLAAFLLLLEPNLITIKREVRPGHTLILIDQSQSMGHRDSFRQPEVEDIAKAWRELQDGEPSEVRRIDLARSVLAEDDQALLTELAKNNRVLVYGFGAGLEPLAVIDLQEAGEEAAGDIDQTGPAKIDLDAIEATGRYSNLGGAVRQALERSRDSAVAGIIMLSDGRRNLGAQGAEIARMLEQRRIPSTIVVPVGDPSATRTVTLTRLEAPDKVFQKDPYTIRAEIEAQGYADIEVTVHLKLQADEGSQAVTIRSEQVSLGNGQREALIEFDQLSAEHSGVFTHIVEIEPPALEPSSPERHVQRKQIEVLGEQTRVLLIAGGPSHEYRFLRNMLTRDKTVQLSCWLCSADPDFPQDGNISLASLPADRAELEEFDVFIFLDPDSRALEKNFCDMVAEMVTDGGAGLWWACGEKFTLEALRPGASTETIADLLPVVPDLVKADHEVIGFGRGRPRAWRYKLTAAGRAHKAARLLDNREASDSLWERLPGFFFAFPIERSKPAAQILIEHRSPVLVANDGSAMPLVASQFIGAGRVLFSGTDDTYRWRVAFEHAYERFWVKGIRYLFEGRLNAGGSRTRILLDEEKLELGQPLHVQVQARDEDYQPLIADSFPLEMQAEDGGIENLTLDPVPAMPGHFETRFRPTSIGYFRLSGTGGENRKVQATFQVVPAAIEKQGPADMAELAAIASVGGGLLLQNPSGLREAAEQIPSKTVIDPLKSAHGIWDSWMTIAFILGLLTVEWWLRKRFNLL